MTILKRRWDLSRWIASDHCLIQRIQRAAFVLTLAAVFIWMHGLTAPAAADSTWQPLVDRLVADGFDKPYIDALFGRKALVFSPKIMARKMNALLNTKLSTSAPGPKETPKVLESYLNPILIAGAYAFYREHKDVFGDIERRFGVPGDILTGLLLVETKLGRQVGTDNGLTILASMALGGNFELIREHIKRKDLPDDMAQWLVKRTTQKGNWAYEELKALIAYARQNGQDPLTIPSSMYGAIGVCQFMPTNAMHYGVDGTGDGRVDLFNMTDALYSMANFVSRHGWKSGLDDAGQRKVIYRYNHSESYAMTILAVADKIRKTDAFLGF